MFLNEMNCRESLTPSPSRKTTYWTDTGDMAMFRQMRTADSEQFIDYAAALVYEFQLRHAYNYGDKKDAGVLLQALKKVGMDADIGALDAIQEAEFPVGVGAMALDAVAEMCTRRPHNNVELEWSSTGHSVASVYRQLYEAGYLTQLSATRVGIPNPEIFDAFYANAELVYARSNRPGNFHGSTLEMLGIGHGDLVAFASYLADVISQQPSPITGKTPEMVYHLNLSFLLGPLVGVGGFAVEHETAAEGGRADIRVLSISSNTSTKKPFVIFELKQLDYGTYLDLKQTMSSKKLVRGPFKYLHTMNRTRTQFIRSHLADLSRLPRQETLGRAWIRGRRVVDIGCGGGLASESLARLGMQVLGNVEMARIHAQRDPALARNLEYIQMTAEQLVAAQGGKHAFDVVVSLEVTEFVADPVVFVWSLVNLAAPGASLFISTMSRI
ncbi:Hexaprenyldihydroxybenzoate methyltransferase, mitochondrial [Coemansia sp. RSA 2424]|nr:Hexaprenyldihydroxybenzoate methyltransferase, mitochondrial [Coemansia sp. RSA 2424]